MCTTYFLEDSRALRGIAQAAAHHKLRERISTKLAQPVVTQGEVRPGDIVPVIAPDRSGEGHVYPMVWGFSGKNSLIPRLDTELLAETRNTILLDAWYRHRCLIPASWYYEWERLHPEIGYDTYGNQSPESDLRFKYMGNGQVPGEESTPVGDRYMIQTHNSAVTLLAGLYRIEELDGVRIPHFMILMQYACDDLMFIHSKMPVIFDSSDSGLLHDWLDPKTVPQWDVDRLLNSAVTNVMFEKSPVRRSSDRESDIAIGY